VANQNFLQCYGIYYRLSIERHLLVNEEPERDIQQIHWFSHNVAMIKSVDVARHTTSAYQSASTALRAVPGASRDGQRDIVHSAFSDVRRLGQAHRDNKIDISPIQLGMVNGKLGKLIPFCLPSDGLGRVPYVQLNGLSAAKQVIIPVAPHTAPLPSASLGVSRNVGK
jgi:hypothetical protein